MVKVTHEYRVEDKTVGYYCSDENGNRARLEPAELKKCIRAGQVINARLSANKICLVGVGVSNVQDYTNGKKTFIKGAAYRMVEIVTNKKMRSYPFDYFYRRKDDIQEVAFLCAVAIEDLGERQWYNPKIQPAMNLIFELEKQKQWDCIQCMPHINQLYNMAKTWRIER